MAEKRIENCNSCDTAEKLAELPVLVLAKFSEDLVDMAKENWCESHIIMLRRLILAVQQGTRYDETLLPEEEAEQTLKDMEKGVQSMAKYQEVRQCVECGKIYPKVPYICCKCGARLLENRQFLLEMKTYRTDSCRVVIAKRGLFGWKVKESEG